MTGGQGHKPKDGQYYLLSQSLASTRTLQSFPCFLVETHVLAFPKVSFPRTVVLAGSRVKVGVGWARRWAVPSISLSSGGGSG